MTTQQGEPFGADDRPTVERAPSGAAGAAPRRPWHHRATVRWLVAAVTLVIGLAVGGVIVGFAMTGRNPALPSRTVTVTPSAAAPGAALGSRSPAAGVAAVNDACLRALDDSQTSLSGLGGLTGALRALDPARIDHELLQLQARQAQLQRDLRACHVSARVATATPRR